MSIQPSPALPLMEVGAPAGWFSFVEANWSEPEPEQRPETLTEKVRRLAAEKGLIQTLFLQTWKLQPEHATTLVDEHIGNWDLKLGMGVWPDRPPPAGFTEDSLNNAAAAVFREDEIPLPNHPVMHVHITKSQERNSAVRLLQQGGTLLEIFTTTEAKVLFSRAAATFLPTILEPRFRRRKFYVPLVEAKTVAGCKDPSVLNEWLCGASLYIRQSSEDGGVLVVGKSADFPSLFPAK